MSRTDLERVSLSRFANEIDVSASDATFSDAGVALYVGTAGDVKVDMVGGGTVTFVGVSGWMPILVKKVYNTGTDASDIVALA